MIYYKKKEWHSLNTDNQNKPKMVRFLKFKFLFILKLNFNGGQFYKKYQNLVILKSGKSHNKVALLSICVVKFEVENFVQLL